MKVRDWSLRLFVAVALCVLSSCGPGWNEYEDQYSPVGPVVTEPWEGDEAVFVELDETAVEVALEGMQTYVYQGALAVLLSDVIIQSGLAQSYESFRYDFTATDGYNLFIKRYEDIHLLPSWDEMKNGYLYWDSRYDDLACGWTQHPWGSALSAYNVKWMNGGTIALMRIE